MPVTKSAKKKLRQDKKRQERNKKIISAFKNLIKKTKKQPSESTLRAAVKAIDKAAKGNAIHKNKAARLKSSLSKLSLQREEKHPKAMQKKKSGKKVVSPKNILL